MAKTLITAPIKGARPAQKSPAHQQPAPRMPTPEAGRSAPLEDAAPDQPQAQAEQQPDSRAADLEALHAIETRLADGLSGVEEKRAEHQAALEQIAADLAALPGWIEAAETRLVTLQQEQVALPRKINAAKALLVGVAGTKAEDQAREDLDTLQARQDTLPPELAKAEAELQKARAGCEAKQAQLEQDRAEHRAALDDLRAFAEALQEEAGKARRQIAEAVYASLEAEQQQRQATLDAAEQTAEQARAAMRALAEQAKARLQQPAPDLLLQFQAAHVPVQDAVTERLEATLAYRRALLSWQKSGDYWQGFPVFWFPFRDVELGMPDIQGLQIREIEAALRKHIAQQQQRIR